MDIFNLYISTKIPVYKSRERDNLNNCRPITVLPIIARVFEKLFYGQLYSYLMNNKFLHDRQFEFRSLHSTALAFGKAADCDFC